LSLAEEVVSVEIFSVLIILNMLICFNLCNLKSWKTIEMQNVFAIFAKNKRVDVKNKKQLLQQLSNFLYSN